MPLKTKCAYDWFITAGRVSLDDSGTQLIGYRHCLWRLHEEIAGRRPDPTQCYTEGHYLRGLIRQVLCCCGLRDRTLW